MLLAAVGDDPYNIVYFFHIVSIIVGTGAAFVVPVIAARVRSVGGTADVVETAGATLMAPGLLVGGIFGGALVGLSDGRFDFGQTWLALGGLIWIVAVVAAALAYPPSFVNLPDMSDRKPMLSGILHLSLAVMLVLMTWKFGL